VIGCAESNFGAQDEKVSAGEEASGQDAANEQGDSVPEQEEAVPSQEVAQEPEPVETVEDAGGTEHEVRVAAIVHFCFERHEIMPNEAEILNSQRVADLVREVAGDEEKVLLLEGHTDALGSEEINLKIGQWRAETVKAFLLDRYGDVPNVRADQFVVVSYGKSRSTFETHAANRRVWMGIVSANFERHERYNARWPRWTGARSWDDATAKNPDCVLENAVFPANNLRDSNSYRPSWL